MNYSENLKSLASIIIGFIEESDAIYYFSSLLDKKEEKILKLHNSLWLLDKTVESEDVVQNFCKALTEQGEELQIIKDCLQEANIYFADKGDEEIISAIDEIFYYMSML